MIAQPLLDRIAALEREVTEARDAFMKLHMEQFIGPCAHGRDPYERCDECVMLTATEAGMLAARAEARRAAMEEAAGVAYAEADRHIAHGEPGYAASAGQVGNLISALAAKEGR